MAKFLHILLIYKLQFSTKVDQFNFAFYFFKVSLLFKSKSEIVFYLL
jgi:hypothetical protein